MSERLDQNRRGPETLGPDAASLDAASLDAALRAAEATVRQGGEPGPLQMASLERLVEAHPERARRLSRRLDRVFATTALRSREVPDGILDGLFDDIRAGASDRHAGRARMSTAFLEAPNSLVAWRRAAVAATVLLAVGGVWIGMREPVARLSRSSPLQPAEDPRFGLLEPLRPEAGFFRSESGTPESSGGLVRAAGISASAGMREPAHGSDQFGRDRIYTDGQGEWRVDPGIARARRVGLGSVPSVRGARERRRREEGR